MKGFDDLLDSRICDLKLRLHKTYLKCRVDKLYEELKARHLRFRPLCYFADEWFVPEGDPVIGIPFYLATHRLKRLERKMMGEVEGMGLAACMKLLRHETGHAISYAYKLHRHPSFKKVFGPSSRFFTERYKFNPRSKKFVLHLDDHYAQSHPDEDFAETFAVWLTYPEKIWTQHYRGWSALGKIRLVDELMKTITHSAPLVQTGEKMCHVDTLRYTVWTYYRRRRALLEAYTRGRL